MIEIPPYRKPHVPTGINSRVRPLERRRTDRTAADHLRGRRTALGRPGGGLGAAAALCGTRCQALPGPRSLPVLREAATPGVCFPNEDLASLSHVIATEFAPLPSISTRCHGATGVKGEKRPQAGRPRRSCLLRHWPPFLPPVNSKHTLTKIT